jgi:holo-[acyl-carrier protein] synthase
LRSIHRDEKRRRIGYDARMIVGIGMDLAQIERVEGLIQRRGDRVLERLFTAGERAYCEARGARAAHYAGRFAVKEAVMKLLGTGWARGVRWVDIEVVREPRSAPRVVLHGAAGRIAEELGIARVFATITHDAGLAAAVVVGESDSA